MLLCIAREPGLRLRDIARLDITDLTAADYVVKHEDGRRNRH